MTSIDELIRFRNNKNIDILVEKYSISKAKGNLSIVPFVGAGLSAFCYPGWFAVLAQLNQLLGGDNAEDIQSELDNWNYEKAAEMFAIL